MDINLDTDIAKLIFSSVFALITFGLWLRRKLSRDSLEIVKDRAEENVIKHLEDERDKLLTENDHIKKRIEKVEAERNEAQQMVSRLSVEVKHLSEKVQELKEITEQLMIKLETATKELHEHAIYFAAHNMSEKRHNAAGIKTIIKEE